MCCLKEKASALERWCIWQMQVFKHKCAPLQETNWRLHCNHFPVKRDTLFMNQRRFILRVPLAQMWGKESPVRCSQAKCNGRTRGYDIADFHAVDPLFGSMQASQVRGMRIRGSEEELDMLVSPLFSGLIAHTDHLLCETLANWRVPFFPN